LAPPQIRESASLRRGLFKKREKLSNADDSDLDSSPSTPRNAQTGEEAAAAGSSASPLLPAHAAKKKSGGKLHFGNAFLLIEMTVLARSAIRPLRHTEFLLLIAN
uniref:Ion_trans domain-containing protein n=1 Tax=Gongylonema pulchrum TaxID=637853 RepID=A0A183EMZ4_9BILA